ncbi:SpoIIIAH-like family protein [Cohnella lubricantis]|uniref:SpoIIIAH-like family protein n=1 Tax=Cohnella lubricantis TaxID=2163172 RepID=A0A841T4A9_9BACL|nr:SpoIIIAH-like family protein [Cohnella lubricantis]MBB6676403.1 SpoIIIAH-like family protein [Cohnella lubricantis]MBP2117590.1 stage III sporulation protein AH [Cohnella lubricantis]
MNNRRQTIWLVSMLSLMVILSAYYLFTEDAPSATKTADNAGYEVQDGITGNAGDVEVSEVESSTGDGTDQGAAANGEDGDSALSPGDEAVLEQYNSQTGRAYFDQIQLDRLNKISQEQERLNAIIGNTSKYSLEEAADARAELDHLEDTEERITSLETKLNGEYGNAVVEETNNNYKVVVQADKLDKQEAVTIVETAMKELNVGPGQVSVQYISNP